MKGAIEVPLFPYALFQAIHGLVLLPCLFPMPFCKNQAERQELYENQDSLRERVSDT